MRAKNTGHVLSFFFFHLQQNQSGRVFNLLFLVWRLARFVSERSTVTPLVLVWPNKNKRKTNMCGNYLAQAGGSKLRGFFFFSLSFQTNVLFAFTCLSSRSVCQTFCHWTDFDKLYEELLPFRYPNCVPSVRTVTLTLTARTLGSWVRIPVGLFVIQFSVFVVYGVVRDRSGILNRFIVQKLFLMWDRAASLGMMNRSKEEFMFCGQTGTVGFPSGWDLLWIKWHWDTISFS